MRSFAAFLIRKVLPLILSAAAGYGIAQMHVAPRTAVLLQSAADTAAQDAANRAADAVEKK